MKTLILLLTVFFLIGSSAADIVYENGFSNGEVNAWQINFGHVVSEPSICQKTMLFMVLVSTPGFIPETH